MEEAGEVVPRSQESTVERKLRAIREASKHEFPTADIEDMLREIDEGRLSEVDYVV
jgi:hypothetical protein